MSLKSLSVAAVLLATLCSSPALAQMGPPQPLPAEALVDPVDPAKAAWLRAHTVIDGPVSGGLTFALPDRFYRSKLILLGESHGVAAPQILDFELLRHLNDRIGLTDYVAEVDPVQGDRLNHYLETGDAAALDRVFDHWSRAGAQWGNTAFEDKVRRIRSLNQTLPAERRIRFIGIDAIQDWLLVGEWLTSQGRDVDLSSASNADKARAALAALDGLDGPAVPRLRGVLERVAQGRDRESVIFETYAQAVRSGELGGRPAYGLWGMFHAMQGPVNGARPFAARVRESDLPTADAVATLVVLSLDSAVQIPVPTPEGVQRMRLDKFNIDGPFVMVRGASTLRAASEPGRITLFDSAAPGSPLTGADFLKVQTSVGQNFDLDPGAAQGRYAQYLGVFRNSDWAPPRE